jgi:hypothetical protein
VILKIGNVSANSNNFHFNSKDFITRYLMTCLDLNISVQSNCQLEMIPVNIVSYFIGFISKEMIFSPKLQQVKLQRSFIISNSKSLTYSKIGSIIQKYINTKTKNDNNTIDNTIDNTIKMFCDFQYLSPKKFVDIIQSKECPLSPLVNVLVENDFWGMIIHFIFSNIFYFVNNNFNR